jgi:hypothetical protein
MNKKTTAVRPGAKVGRAMQPRRRYTLDELLAQCNPKAPRAPEEREWLDSKPLGGELI